MTPMQPGDPDLWGPDHSSTTDPAPEPEPVLVCTDEPITCPMCQGDALTWRSPNGMIIRQHHTPEGQAVVDREVSLPPHRRTHVTPCDGSWMYHADVLGIVADRAERSTRPGAYVPGHP